MQCSTLLKYSFNTVHIFLEVNTTMCYTILVYAHLACILPCMCHTTLTYCGLDMMVDQIRRPSGSRSGTSSARGTASTPTERGRTGRQRPATGRRLAQTSPSWRPVATARRSALRRRSCSTAGSRQRASRLTGSCTSTASRMRRAQPPAGRLATSSEARPQRLSGYVCYYFLQCQERNIIRSTLRLH